MSGEVSPTVIDLVGTTMSALALAVPAITERTGREVIVVRGLAVVCRLTRPYRATSDLDTVNRRRNDEPAQLELLVASGAKPSGVSGVIVPTSAGPVQVDVLEVTDAELAPLPGDPTDRLHVLSHTWAAASATPASSTASYRHAGSERRRGGAGANSRHETPVGHESRFREGGDGPSRHRPPLPGPRRRAGSSRSTGKSRLPDACRRGTACATLVQRSC